jgi:hypothetical protein
MLDKESCESEGTEDATGLEAYFLSQLKKISLDDL